MTAVLRDLYYCGMGNAKIDKRTHYTYGEYRTWPGNERWELIEGQAWNMSPSPSWTHQELAGIIHSELRSFLKGKPCRPFIAPVDVLLPNADSDRDNPDAIDTVVQPDIGVVCDRAKITLRGVIGAPDLIMEIISPSSVIRDLNLKKKLYGQHGCREYWVLDARLSWVTRFVRQGDGWDEGTCYDPSATAQSALFPGFQLILPDIRAEMGIND